MAEMGTITVKCKACGNDTFKFVASPTPGKLAELTLRTICAQCDAQLNSINDATTTT